MSLLDCGNSNKAGWRDIISLDLISHEIKLWVFYEYEDTINGFYRNLNTIAKYFILKKGMLNMSRVVQQTKSHFIIKAL